MRTNDLISKQALIDYLREYKVSPAFTPMYSFEDKGYNDGVDFAISVVSTFPSAEQEEQIAKVKRVSYGDYMTYDCDGECECGKCVDALWDYCPKCGAKLEWER